MFKDFNSCSRLEQDWVIRKWYRDNPGSDVPETKLRDFFSGINVRFVYSNYVTQSEVLESLTRFKEKYESFN